VVSKSGKILSELAIRVKLWKLAAGRPNFYVDKATGILSRFISYMAVSREDPHE
jgi:hypothetical protein